jgi:DNA polymerase-3 subunit epsilon
MLPSTLSKSQRFVVFDLETTGLSHRQGDRVIEIGAVAIKNRKTVVEFHSLVKVAREINPFAERVHGISNAMLQNHPPAEKVMPAFHKFIQHSILVAHNATFDLGFIAHEFALLGLPFDNASYCTLKLCRALYPALPSHRLEAVYRHLFKKVPEGMHRALADAQLTAHLWLKIEPQVIRPVD